MRQKQTHDSPFISHADRPLYDKGTLDQNRHDMKVKEALRRQLSEVISDESLIISNGQKKVKIAVQSLEEFRFRFGDPNAGQPNDQSAGADGERAKVGDEPGEWVLEHEVDLESIEELLFAELELPDLTKKDVPLLSEQHVVFNDVRKTGMMANLDKKRSLLAAVRHGTGFTRDTLRFKTWGETELPGTRAVVIAMMDISGSMGAFEKLAARTFFFWLSRFLKYKYEQTELVFIAHHTDAREVDEDTFFQLSENGGTLCSTAYRKANEIIDARFPQNQYNVYAFHFSDGDNLNADNETCVREVGELMRKCSLFGYGEINTYRRTSSLMHAFARSIHHAHFKTFNVREKSDILHALKTFFGAPKEASQ